MIYYKPLKEVSDGLIDHEQLFIDFDGFKNSKKELEKYSSVDSIWYNEKMLKEKKKCGMNLIEFKRCNLFYKDKLDKDEEKIVDSIIADMPSKIIDSTFYLLPAYLNKYGECDCGSISNFYLPIKIEFVLGEKDIRDRLRGNLSQKMKKPQYVRLVESLIKYRSNPYHSCLEILTASQFIKRYEKHWK